MQALDALRQHGVVVIENAVDAANIDRAIAQIDDFRNTNLDWLGTNGLLVNQRLFRVVDLHLLLPELRTMLTAASPQALAVADQIGKASLYTSLYFESGSEQAFHRDTPYFWTAPPYAYAGIWIALEDVDESNGALTAIPGSHLLGEPDLLALRRSFFGAGECPSSHTPLFDAYNSAVRDMALAAGLQPAVFPVRKGDAIIWNASTLHGGIAHVDKKRSRKSFVMHVTPRGVPVVHMQYFFHPERPMPERAPWGYFEERGRAFAAHNHVGFMHKLDLTPEHFDASYRYIGA